MTVVVLGVDALDPEILTRESHSNLTLEEYRAVDTINSSAGEPSTHELWPTIITGLRPSEHGLTLEDDGVAWGNPVLELGSVAGDFLLPNELQTRIGAWLLTNTDADAFRTPATYYDERGITTLFDGRESTAIGIPNYVVNPESQDREHVIRQSLGDLFQRDPEAVGGHTSADLEGFYERCLEMAMVRIARTRRALRGGNVELTFGYTSALDLVGHVAHEAPDMQKRAYEEVDEFVGELRADLQPADELVVVSDHGLQNGVHTDQAVIAATDPDMLRHVGSVLDVRDAIEAVLDKTDHTPKQRQFARSSDVETDAVREQLENLGYMDQ